MVIKTDNTFSTVLPLDEPLSGRQNARSSWGVNHEDLPDTLSSDKLLSPRDLGICASADAITADNIRTFIQSM